MKLKYYGLFFVFVFSLFIVNVYANSSTTPIIELNGDGSWNWVVTLSPVVITTTPESSQTPWIITYTPDILTPTPTQETTLPPTQPTMTSTPSPTMTPIMTPTPDRKCWGVVTVNLHVRSEPGGTSLGVISAGDTLTLKGYWTYLGYDWYQHYWLPRQVGYSHSSYIVLAPDADCSDLPDVTPQATHSVALLWHTVPGFNIENARISHQILGDKGIEFGYKNYASMWATLETLNNGGIGIYRHPNQDYPQNIGGADPVQSAHDFFYDYGRYVCDTLRDYDKAYYEPINEPNLGSTDSDAQLNIIYWWRDWMMAYMDVAFAYECPKLIMPTSGPGWGYAVHYRIWKETLIRLASHSGMIGEHAYTIYPDVGLCACDEWLGCRHRKNEELRQAEGVDIDVAITEAARGWGNDPVDVSDFVCWYEEIRNDTFIHSVSLWTLGFHPTWPNANLDTYVIPISNSVLTN